MSKPFSQACENNQEPIRSVISSYLKQPSALLEVGSGTGQHAAYISKRHPELSWQTSDVIENHAGIHAWMEDAQASNFLPPIELDINTAQWHKEKVDMVFSANTAHIMSWQEVEKFFAFIPMVLKTKGHFLLYGPFNYNGEFTSESNAHFNEWLKSQAAHRAIRDFEAVNQLAEQVKLQLVQDHEMPANNRLLVWRLCP